MAIKRIIINDSVVSVSTERYSIIGGCDVLLKHAQLDTRLSAFVVVSTLMHGSAKNSKHSSFETATYGHLSHDR